MELLVEALEITETRGDAQQRLVERPREEGIEQILMNKCEAKNTTGKSEPVVVIVDEGGHRRYLDGIGVVRRVLEEAVIRIEELA